MLLLYSVYNRHMFCQMAYTDKLIRVSKLLPIFCVICCTLQIVAVMFDCVLVRFGFSVNIRVHFYVTGSKSCLTNVTCMYSTAVRCLNEWYYSTGVERTRELGLLSNACNQSCG